MIDSPYTISIVSSKNCYLTGLGSYLENIYYSYWAGFSKDSMELMDVAKCENCYELNNCSGCYSCYFCEDCSQCIDSYFLYDCRNCQNCFGCVNLRHKFYCLFNEQLTKEEYKKKNQRDKFRQ